MCTRGGLTVRLDVVGDGFPTRRARYDGFALVVLVARLLGKLDLGQGLEADRMRRLGGVAEGLELDVDDGVGGR